MSTGRRAGDSGHASPKGAVMPAPRGDEATLRGPDKVWGRETELAQLTAALDSSRTGATVTVLVDGLPGIGKSAVVEEFHQRAVARCTATGGKPPIFAMGKCDLQSRAPYGALGPAISSFVVSVLVEGPNEVARTKAALVQLLGLELDVLTSILPRTQILFGAPKSSVVMDNPNTPARFMNAIVTLVRYFAIEHDPSRPCILYIDDLQWCDEHTVRILDAIMTDTRMSHLLVVCSYRTNEIPPALSSVIFGCTTFQNAIKIPIAGLTVAHVTSLINEVMGDSAEDASAIAEQIRVRTGGNPLHIMEVLRFLQQNRSLAMAGTANAAVANARAKVSAAGMLQEAGELQELLAQRMKTMRPEVITVLTCASMIGSSINMVILRQAVDLPLDVIEEALLTAVDAGMLEQLKPGRLDSMGGLAVAGNSIKYRFLHDRIREAALSQQPDQHITYHVRIAVALLKRLPAAERLGTATASQALFDICDHLNAVHLQAAHHVLNKDLRVAGSQLNFIAGKASHKMVSFAAALAHIRMARAHGAELARLTESSAESDTSLSAAETVWRYDHTRGLELALEEMAILLQLGDTAAATAVLDDGMRHAKNVLEKARLLKTRIYSNISKLDDNMNMLAMGREAIAMMGNPLPSRPDQETWAAAIIAKHDLHNPAVIENAINLPLATDEHTLMLSELMSSFLWNTYLGDPAYLPSVCLMAWDVAMTKGMTDHLTAPMGMYAFVLGNKGEYTLAGTFWEIVSQMADRYGYRAQKGATLAAMCAMVMPYYKPLREVQDEVTLAREMSQETGDYNFVAYSDVHWHTTEIMRALPLDQMMKSLPQHVVFARSCKNPLAIGMMESDLRYVAKMAAHDKYADFLANVGEKDIQDDETFANRVEVAHSGYSHASNLVFTAFYHLVYDTGDALRWALRADDQLQKISGVVTVILHAFVQAMALLRKHKAGDTIDPAVMETIQARRTRVEKVATSAPFNFRPWLLLIDVELLRVSNGNQSDVILLLSEAIAIATRSNMLHIIGYGHEVMARYWREVIPGETGAGYAASHIEMAVAAYTAYGALARVGILTAPTRTASLNVTASHSVDRTQLADQLDAVFLLRASQAIASELRPARLLEIALPILMEASGAEHACLLGLNDDGAFISDVSSTSSAEIYLPPFVNLPAGTKVEPSHLLLPLINLVGGTCKDMIIADAAQDGYFWNDEYVRKNNPRSILCACLYNRRGVVRKILYMENNQYPGAFTGRQLKFVNGLLNQLAISLETARMYANLEDTSKALTGEVEKRTLSQNAVAAAAATESQKALQARQRYLADVVHDLRTPMNAVVSLGQLLLETPLDDAQREHVTAIKRTGEQITRQITSILDISKLDASKMTLELEPTELRLCVRDCCALARAELSDANITIKTEVDDKVPWIVLTDGFRFRQILNIVLGFTASNSIVITLNSMPTIRPVASAESKHAWPAAYNPDMLPWREISCTVRDVGQTPRDREGDEATKNADLSMMIAKSLLELMGGRISQGEGAGWPHSFFIMCPMLQEKPASPPPSSEPVYKILIVEANENDRRTLARHLRFLAHLPETASNVKDSMTLLTERHYDIAFVAGAVLHSTPELRDQLRARNTRCIGILSPGDDATHEGLPLWEDVIYRPVKLADVMTVLRAVPKA